MTLGAASAGQSVVSINQLIDPLSAQLLAGQINLTLKGSCNHAHSISLTTTHGGLQPQNGAAAVKSGAFLDRIDYVVQAGWASSTMRLHTASRRGQTAPANITGGAFSGNLQLQIILDQDAAGSTRIISGTYSDQLIITLKPQL